MATTQKHYLKINPYLDIISGITVVLSFSDGIIKIVGREGSGKSVLTQLLAAELIEENQEVVIFSDIPHSEPELHDPIQQQLHLNLGPDSDFYAALNKHIQARPFDQQKLILVFDDADQIPDDCFEAIRMLFEKNYHDRPEVSMVFAGTELLDQKLSEPQNRTFNKNIILNFEVKPMNRSELEAFCNAYLVEMGLQQKHHLSKEELDEIFTETRGLPGRIPELIFAILDRSEEKKKAEPEAQAESKKVISKLVTLHDDPEPELKGLSVEDREEVLTTFKDQVPWRWQSNGVGIAVVILFTVVAYGSLVPEAQRTGSIVVFPPPARSAGQLSLEEQRQLSELLARQQLTAQTGASEVPAAGETPTVEEPGPAAGQAAPDTPEAVAEAPVETAPAVTPETAAESAGETAVAEPEPAAEPAAEVAATQPPQAPAAETAAPETEPPAPAAGETPAVATATPTPPPAPVEEQEPAPEEPAATPAQPVAETAQGPAAQQREPVQVAQTTPGPVAEPQDTPAAQPAIEPITFVENWLSAWENQNVGAYLDAYGNAFDPGNGMTLAAWQADRTSRIERPDGIDITLESAEITDESPRQATVRVQFTYETENYADRTVKSLVLSADNRNWRIADERNVSVERLPVAGTASRQAAGVRTLTPAPVAGGESGYEAKVRQVLSLAGDDTDAPFGEFINDWLGAWKNQDVEGYFRHYHDNFRPANFDTKSDWRADRIRKINEKRFIDIAFDDVEVLDEDDNTTRIRFWLSYASSFYLDRTWKEVVISGDGDPDDTGIVRERNLAVQIIPFYP